MNQKQPPKNQTCSIRNADVSSQTTYVEIKPDNSNLVIFTATQLVPATPLWLLLNCCSLQQ
jgi:hypothetical protein